MRVISHFILFVASVTVLVLQGVATSAAFTVPSTNPHPPLIKEIPELGARLVNFEPGFLPLKEYPENRDQEVVRNKIADLLTNPKVVLYSGENFTGEAESLPNVRGDCVQYRCGALQKLSGKVKSVQTLGTCVRLFQSPYSDLTGWSLAVYPGSTIPENILYKLEGVHGIGPCLPYEFDGATIDPSTQLLTKNISDIHATVPDLLEFFSFTKRDGASSMNTSYPRDKYLLGPMKRVEFLRKDVYKTSLKPNSQPSSTMKYSAFYKSRDKNPGDIMGYGIPTDLGGQANENFNIFPQTKAGADEWLRITSDIPSYVRDDNWVVIALNFMYDNVNATRPYAFYYYLNYNKEKILYGRIRNN